VNFDPVQAESDDPVMSDLYVARLELDQVGAPGGAASRYAPICS
jgi:hypothetical protein